MDFEIGTLVVETEGFFKGFEFTVTGDNIGVCDKSGIGERKLQSPIVPTVPKLRRITDVQRLQDTDPKALEQSKKYGPCIYIYSQPSVIEHEASRGGFEAKFIKPTSELSHGAKYDILFSKPVPSELMSRLAAEISDVDIINNRICSRNLALWLIAEGMLPMLPVL
jgi:hypothetical protein